MTDITQKDQGAGQKTAGVVLQEKIRLAVVEKTAEGWTLQFYGEVFHLPKELQTLRQVKTFCIGVMGFNGIISLRE